MQFPPELPVRKSVFWPPVILLIFAVVLSILYPGVFDLKMREIQNWILINFSLGFSWLSFLMTLLIGWVFFSPLGKYRIGGENAKPRLHTVSWFAIVLCTTIAVGILFWGSAEPLSHFLFPPEFFPIEHQSEAAKSFALGALFFHWGFTPYATYAVPALLFGLMYHQKKNKFRLGLMLKPTLGTKKSKFSESLVDMISLFALVAGMAASLGAGILSLSGGIQNIFPNVSFSLSSSLVTVLIVFTFVISAKSGIEKGIKNLSLFNLGFFLIFISLFLILTNGEFLKNIMLGFQQYFSNFLDLSLQISGKNKQWTYDWSTFNFAIWMAWAPITALFLGKIAIGRTVREFLLVSWFFPALFCLIWMGIFGGSTLDLALISPDKFLDSFVDRGPESIIYLVFEEIGYYPLFAGIFLIAMFISYVTAADSSTEGLASLSMRGGAEDDFHVPSSIKIFWGILIGATAWIMINFSGIDGVRILSVIGGLPALFFLSLVSIGLALVSFSPKKYL
ncbi:Choline-glycine betaine transporter [Algoriphagus ornithinivorans]|uniref:Choline-glycine betaine transporter n=1 Tax=Algoriphagus ornithinivorans TaxID=226506 RepID=A0A1I5GQZ8_9BACT|nr:BCCT family transporter [Algoriphagus ornithinivorans]SFO38347.1 Choline-glycine betaine transporter [Algoriphagus ornithinivorans]